MALAGQPFLLRPSRPGLSAARFNTVGLGRDAPVTGPSKKKIAAWLRDFMEALPTIEKVARFRLRAIRGQRRDEVEADLLYYAWANYRSLCERGIDPKPFLGKIAEYSCRAAASASRDPINEPLSRYARDRRGFTTQSLHAGEDGELPAELAATLADRKVVSPADEAAANLDFQEWLDSLSVLERQVAGDMMAGLDNTEVGKRHGFSRGWGSLLRVRLRNSWKKGR